MNIVVNETPTYDDCTATTYSGATIAALTHSQSQNFTQSIASGTGDVTATCTN